MSTPAPSPAPALWRTVVAGGTAAGLLLSTACAPEDRTATPPGVSAPERDLTFTAGDAEVSATFTSPSGTTGTVPGALIVSGSGPTDRDGNSPMRPGADTNLNFSRLLASSGVASLRYDKLGSGETAPGDHGPDAPVDREAFDEQMAAAYEQLVAQPEVDPDRVAVLGHSEGALYALRAHDLVDDSPALILAAPPGTRYLDLVDRQLTQQVRVGEAAGRLTDAESVQLLSDARAGRAALRAGRTLPDDMSPELEGAYSPENADFLAWIDGLDPVELAEDLPGGPPVLVLWGEEDTQVPREDIDRLMTGLENADRVDVPDADHVFRYFADEPGSTALDADRPFAEEVAPAMEDFLDTAW